MSIGWYPTTPEDVREIRLIPTMDATDQRDTWDLDDPAVKDTLYTHCRTMDCDGEPLAIIGLHPQWPGLAVAWTLLSEEALEHPVVLLRGCVQWLYYGVRQMGLHRVQATARVDMPAAQRMLEWMGFEPEGRLRGYGPDQTDHYLYARLWGEP